MTRSFLFLLASAREDGNTLTLARSAAEQLPAETEQCWLDLTELRLADFVDGRHDGVAREQQDTDRRFQERAARLICPQRRAREAAGRRAGFCGCGHEQLRGGGRWREEDCRSLNAAVAV